MHRDFFTVEPLYEQIGEFFVLAGGGNRQGKTCCQLGVTARGKCITHFASNFGFRNPLHGFIFDVAGSKATVGRPRNGHGAFALDKGGQVFHETKFLHAWGHEFVFVTPLGEYLHAFRSVDGGLHIGIKELAAFIAKTLLEHEVTVARFAELGSTVSTFGFEFFSQELANFGELFPSGGWCQVVAVLGLEVFAQSRIRKNVFAVVHDENIAVIGEAVNLAVDLHLVVTVGGRDFLQLVAVGVFVYHGVQRL